MDPIVETFLRRAEESPDDKILLSSKFCLSRRELLASAERHAKWLLDSGAVDSGAGTVVAIASPSAPAFLTAFLACRLAGACTLVLEGDTPRASAEETARRIGAGVLWTPGSDALEAEPVADVTRLGPGSALPEVAMIRVTSGSTSDPTGVAMTAEALAADSHTIESSMGLQASDRFLAAVSLNHAYGFSIVACAALHRTGAVVIPDSPAELFEAARRFGATVWPTVPAWLEAQLRAGDQGERIPESVRLMISAGAPLRPETAQRWRSTQDRAVHVLYGSSECGAICYDRVGTAAERGLVGTPADDVEVQLNKDGVVSVCSDAVACGYVPNGKSRSSRIEDGCFVSEDLAEFDGKELRLVGRVSDWVNVKGRKVNPREVETVLHAMPGIVDVAVVGRTLPEGGGEGLRAVVVAEQASLDYRAIVTWCRQRLSPHKIPRSIILTDEIPRTSRGKLDRNAMAEK